MRIVAAWLLAFALFFGVSDLRAGMTVDELVAKNIEARGGLDKLRAITSLRLTGSATFGGDEGGLEAQFAVAQKRGGRIRVEVVLQGLTAVDAYDGTEGWKVEPFQGRIDAFKVSADEVKEMAQDADIDGPLVDWKAKGHKVDYLGTEDIDGTQAHKLRVVLKDGDVQYSYLDPDYFLEIRTTMERKIRGTERVSETDIGNYEQVQGTWIPLATESGRKGRPRSSRITFARAEANVELDDALFKFPAAGAKVARALVPGAASAAPPSVARPPAAARPAVIDAGILSGLGVRNVGSAQISGRVSSVAAYVDSGKTVIYVGAASGGVWKSLDGGTTFRPVFDKNPVQSIGAVTVDPSNPKNVWVGTGEAWTRNSVSIGDGIYKSTDGGATWANMGLPESERIVKILVHPKNGEIVYACVPGKLWSDSTERGLYKTIDGGKHWALVLKGANASTGCSGLTMDPTNPDVLLSGTWDFRRKGWTFRSGGDGPTAPSGSALYRTTDGGKTWTPLAAGTKGLPPGPWGRVEVAIAPSDAKIIYAVIEATDSALFRSSDGGATWEKRDKSQHMVWRPFYFARLVVDPTNAERVFKMGGSIVVSEDGGRSFAETGGGSHGDWHDVWIEPGNPKHLVGGDDGGMWTSYDGGSRWWKSSNLPIAQFYHVSVDAKDPYQVYGGLQDNSSWVGDSAYPGGVSNHRWENLYDGDGFWVVVDPTDPDAVYAESQGGHIGRVDRRTLVARDIQPKAGFKEKLRFNWNTPIHASPTQKGTIYLGAQFLFRSRDRGDSWDRISPDLTTNDKQRQKQEESGGITVDNSAAEMHTTIYSISESPLDAKVIWVGTDDGNLQVTKDGGKTWDNVIRNVVGQPRSWVSWVEASRFEPGTAYAAFDRHTFGDMTAAVYKTTDFGKSWARIVSPAKGVRGYVHVVREDTAKSQLLFVGTELGLWISVDGGGVWTEFKGGDFPSVAVRDLQIHPRDNDLVIATHGRGIWIMDDLTPLRALAQETLAAPAAFLPGRPVQQRLRASGGWMEGDANFSGRNPAGGAVITYYQRTRHLFGALKLEIIDEGGKVVDTVPTTKRRGINRVTWSMQVKPPRVPRAAQLAFSSSQGPRVVPGTYTVRLTKGAEVLETKLAIGLDRRATFDVGARKAQFDAAMRVHALFGDMSNLTDRIQTAKDGAQARVKALPAADPLVKKVQATIDRLDDAKKKIVATKEGGAITGEERIREHTDQLYGAINGWEGRPAQYLLDRADVLRRELEEVSKEVDTIVATSVRPLDDALASRGLTPISTKVAAGAPVDEAPGAEVSELSRCARTRGVECPLAERAAHKSRRQERD